MTTRSPLTEDEIKALREVAEEMSGKNGTHEDWRADMRWIVGDSPTGRFFSALYPETVLSLLDEIEQLRQVETQINEAAPAISFSVGPKGVDTASGGTCPKCGGSLPSCCSCPLPCDRCGHVGMAVNGFCRAVIGEYGPQSERRVCGCACYTN